MRGGLSRGSLAVRDRLARLGPGDRDTLALWLVTRLGTVVVVASAGWLFATDDQHPIPFLDRWLRWDAVHYASIAEYGYGGGPGRTDTTPLEAFFPGLPFLLRLLAELGLGYSGAGLLVSFVAGGVGVLALRRIGIADAMTSGRTSEDGPQRVGLLAVLLLLTSPCMVFLAAGYTEALFLGLGLPAWLAARRGSWATAGLLATAASTVRVTGLFLALALVVEYAFARGRRRGIRGLAWLVLPVLPLAAYSAYLYGRTGDWFAWQHAQAEHWQRTFTLPWDALATTWRAAFLQPGQPPGFAWYFRLEIVFALVGVLLTLWLAWRQRWAEVTYVGLQVGALLTSQFYLSIPRASLLWWPLWTGLALAAARRRWLLATYLAVSVPLAVLIAGAYSMHRWAG